MFLKLNNPLVFFDLETTGINISKDRIVEASFIKWMPSGEKDIKTLKINPEIPIPVESSLIHGIYDKDVESEPTFKEVAKNLTQFLKGCDLGGYNNLKFDVPMLVEEFLRVDVEFDVEKRKIVDAQRIFHMMEKRNLKAAYKFYCDKILEKAHSAEVDAMATLEVFEEQIKKYEGQPAEDLNERQLGIIKNDIGSIADMITENMVDFAGRMVINAKNEVVFNFGKHKGRLVTEVFEKEPGYYDWMMRGDFPLDTKRKLTKIKLSALAR
ncbi:MAG: 3'-5' exonuclease [Bacteroidota bacterium]